MSIKNEDIINAISKMNIVDLMDLIKEIEKKFDISASTINLQNTNANEKSISENTSTEKEEQKLFSVVMTSYGNSKINVIKSIRSILELGLKEAKEFVEDLPATIKKEINKDEAEKLKSDLEKIGAKIDIK